MAILQIKESCVGLKRMSVLAGKCLQADSRLRFERAGVMEQVEVDFSSPGFWGVKLQTGAQIRFVSEELQLATGRI